MFDSPRPAKSMSAIPNGFALRSFPVRTLALALAATMLPCVVTSFAATHHAPAKPVASARSRAVPAHHAAAALKPTRGHAVAAPKAHHNAELARAEAAERAPAKPASRHAIAESRPASMAKGSRSTATASRSMAAEEPVRPMPYASRRAVVPNTAAIEAAADRATQDRVHDWYKSRGLAVPDTAPVPRPAAAPAKPVTRAASANAPVAALADEGQTDDSVTPAPIVRIAPPAAKPRTIATHTAPAPDLSPTPRKATVADFDRALQLQTQTVRAAQAEAQAHTTADDDAAEAATQIPSTAPTERVAAPFTHGDLLTSSAASGDFVPRQATLSMPKSENSDKHLNSHTDAEVLAKSPSALNPADGSRPNVRAIADQIANTPTPKLKLAKPAPMAHGESPAVTALNAKGKKQQVDPETMAGLTDETFDEDSDPITTARNAVALAAKSSKADPISKPALASVDDDDDIVNRGTTSPVKVTLFDAGGRLMMIPAMKGTHEILVHQNQMAIADGLDRIEDDDQLQQMSRYKLLVALPDNEALWVDDRLPANRRYARPWSVRFLNDLSRAHYARFGTPLTVTSAARTVEFQKRLVRTNGNAAPPTGDIASPHLYGQAVDIAKHGMSMTEIAWMRAYLTPVESEGKIDVEEEFQQSCFHVSIYRRYLGLPARKKTTPAEPIPERTLQQAKATVPSPSSRKHRLPTAILATGLR